MIADILTTCGLIVAGIGGWRAYAVAREAVGPLARDGDPTRSVIESSRPLLARTRVRLFARRVAVALGWLALAMYGLFLVSAGQAVSG